MTLIAKPIVKNQMRVITDGVTKVGNVFAQDDGFEVLLGDSRNHFSSTKVIEQAVKLEFERPGKISVHHPVYANWPTDTDTYNNFFDVKRRIHVYTKTPKSKCYYAAGYFNVKLNDEWQTLFCPKYLYIQRYPYLGPYNSQEEVPVS